MHNGSSSVKEKMPQEMISFRKIDLEEKIAVEIGIPKAYSKHCKTSDAWA